MNTSPNNDPHENPEDTIEAVPSLPTENTVTFPDYYSFLPDEIKAAEGRGRRSKLYNLMRYAPDVYARVMKYVELGCYGHAAAEAMGIRYDTWMMWLRKGEKARSDSIYAKFVRDVRRAEAKARVMTEIQVRRDNPEFWLQKGPGKSTKARPEGWTDINTPNASLENLMGVGRKEDVSNADLAGTLRAAQELGLIDLLLAPPPSESEDESEE